MGIGTFLYERYSYSDERADLKEYFHLVEENKVAITLGNDLLEEQALLWKGVYYLEIASVKTYLNNRFYVDEQESLLLYSTDVDTYRVVLDTSEYSYGGETIALDYEIAIMQGETLYVALDYVKKFTNFSYVAYQEPMRMQIHTTWESHQVATIQKNTAVRERGGVKSPILSELVAGEEVVILEEMEEWSKIKTMDTYVGYVENKRLEDYHEFYPESVTEYIEPEYESIHKEYKISMGWHQVTNTQANSTIYEVLDASKGINTISPTWYYLKDNEGGIQDISSASYVQAAHSRGIEVWVLVEDITYKNEFDFNELMSYTTKRTKVIDTLVQSVLRCGADGINIDFENVPSDGGEHFIQFIRELSIVCRLNGVILSVDNYVPMPHTNHYNRAEQGVVADYVVIMGYDEHWNGSGNAGSVASIEFVREGIVQTLEEVPSHKVINGVPFYTNVWKTEGTVTTNQQVGMGYAQQIAAENGAEIMWDEEVCQYYARYTIGEAFYQIWLEEEESIATKLNLMDHYDIAGVAQWKLGLEKSSIWDIINEYLQK